MEFRYHNGTPVDVYSIVREELILTGFDPNFGRWPGPKGGDFKRDRHHLGASSSNPSLERPAAAAEIQDFDQVLAMMRNYLMDSVLSAATTTAGLESGQTAPEDTLVPTSTTDYAQLTAAAAAAGTTLPAAGAGCGGMAATMQFGQSFNATVFQSYIRSVVQNISRQNEAKRREIEGDPMIYIVAVLIFYSCGIVILMINYMKKEQHETEEENLYKQYVEKARDRCHELNNRGRSLNRLALQALNAVNIISQDEGQPKVTFV